MGGKSRRVLSTACAILATAAVAEASVQYNLLNHPNGGARSGGYYGLRLDYGQGPETFSFQTDKFDLGSDSTVQLEVFPGPQGTGAGNGRAEITGTMIHNQSGQIWQIFATLEEHDFASDATPWYTSPDVYEGAISDLQTNGANLYGKSGGALKDDGNLDKIVFNLVEVELTLVSPGPPDFDPTSRGWSVLRYYDYPNGNPNGPPDPFVIAKGHRLNNSTDDLVGIGWLGDDPDDPNRPATQDFIFVIGPMSNPEPASAVVWLVAGTMAAAVSRRTATRG